MMATGITENVQQLAPVDGQEQDEHTYDLKGADGHDGQQNSNGDTLVHASSVTL